MSTAKLKTMAECIEDGIKLLDEKRPGWVEKIDLGKFNIKSGCNCVLGQVNGDFFADWEAMGLTEPSAHGFDSSVWPAEEIEEFGFEDLQEAWVARLIDLKAERGVS